MEWLSNLLSAAGNSASPFGALGGNASAPDRSLDNVAMGGTPGAPPIAPPPSPNVGVPGLFGKFLQRPQGNANPLLGQALSMLQPKPMQPVQWMPMNMGGGR